MKKMLFVLVAGLSVILQAGSDFNVKKFGALGDGVADDAPAIQKAIDAAQVKGGCVYFPAGDYRVKKTLEIGGNTAIDPNLNWLTLRGEGGGSKLLGDGVEFILAGRSGSKSPWMHGARIEGLTFRSFDLKNRCNAIDLSLMLRVYITSCNFIRCKGCIISEREFTPYSDPGKKNRGHSIWIVRIHDCIFSANADWAISIRRAFDVVISNNSIEHGSGGIRIGFIEDAKDAACNTLRIENNVIEGLNAHGKAALKLCCVVGGRIVGNYFEANPSGDIEITPKKGGWVRGFVIAANSFQPTRKQQATGVYGPILLEKAFDVTICNNFTTGPRLIHSGSDMWGRNVVIFGNAMGNPKSVGFDGATEAERKAYEQFVTFSKKNRNRFILSGKSGHIGIDTHRGVVFNENAISYSDEVPKTGNPGDVVFCRKPAVKDGRVVIGWYCLTNGKSPCWCPISIAFQNAK